MMDQEVLNDDSPTVSDIMNDSSSLKNYYNPVENAQENHSKTFSVNMSEMMSYAVQEAEELTGVDFLSFNQVDFEHGVQKQLDKAFAAEEMKRAIKLLEKQLDLTQKNLRKVKLQLRLVSSDEKNLNAQANKIKLIEEERKLHSKCTKLKTRIRRLNNKNHTSVEPDQEDEESDMMDKALGLQGPRPETEMEKRIRLGEMTPFGSKLLINERNDEQISKTNSMTEFEKYLADQATKSHAKVKKTKVQSVLASEDIVGPSGGHKPIVTEDFSGPSGSHKTSVKHKLLASEDEDGDVHKRKKLNAKVQESTSKFKVDRDAESEGSEYIPDEEDEMSEGDAITNGKKKAAAIRQKKKLSKKKEIEGSSDSEEESISKKSKKTSIRRGKVEIDDGLIENYQERLKRLRKQRLLQRQKKAENGEPDSSDLSDVDVEGGLRIHGKIWNKLYRYQKTCVQWLWELHCQQAGGILGDEMGLGKTIEIISFLSALALSKLRDKGTNDMYTGLGPVLIICPATVMFQWVKEIHTWWPQRRVAIFHATGTFTCSDESFVYNMVRSQAVMVTSYSNVLRKRHLLLKYNWHYVILDEGHKIRNPDAQITLTCKQFRTVHRLILSGSPVQNNLKELWSLFDFIFPGKLGTLPDFMQHFSVPIVQGGYANASDVQVLTAYKCACILRDTINPYLLRRLKADVNSSIQLPVKNEQVLFCRLTDHQRDVYKEYLNSKQCQQILKGNFLVFPGLITLRKICNHPDLATGGPKVFDEEAELEDSTLQYGYWRRSGKMKVMDALMRMWRRQGHKVLLFSQTRQMLNILEEYIQMQNYSYLRMDGSTNIASRQSLVNKFNKDPSLFVFLLTTRVGGIGVNLTGANRILIYDPDWNPSTDSQARERAWRIGQTRDVTIYRFLTAGTIEEKIYHRQIFKQFLTNRILKDPKQRRFFKSNDLFELFSLADDDGTKQTETGALFSGTGSSVKVKIKSSKGANKPNKFDVLEEIAKTDVSLKLDNDDEVDEAEDKRVTAVSDEKLKAMRELARKISASIGGCKQDKQENECAISDESKHDISKKAEENNGVRTGKTKQGEGQKSVKKKKRKDAKVEGHRIANLVRHSLYQPEVEATVKEEDSAKQDEYVLRKLFKKSNVHSALQHDKIMLSSNPDSLLVENEASRVAKDAAEALKRAREASRQQAIGIPTWTGHHGGQKQRPRFGRIKNSSLMSSASDKQDEGNLTKSSSVSLHFDGSAVSDTKLSPFAGSNHLLSSAELLARMRARNGITNDNEVNEAGEQADPSASDRMTNVDSSYLELAEDLRAFIAFGARVDGQALTQEIMDKFGKRIAPADSAKFRSLLRQLCEFTRHDSVGVWQLRPDFR